MATDPRRAVGLAVALMVLVRPTAGLAQQPDDAVVVPAPSAPPESLLASRYSALGVAVGSPGFVNLTLSHYEPRLLLRAAAGVGGRGRAGAQADLGWRAVRAGALAFGTSLVGGVVTTQEPSDVSGSPRQRHPFAGGAFDLDLDGFRVQVGLARQFGNTTSTAQLLAQLGYERPLHRRKQGDSGR